MKFHDLKPYFLFSKSQRSGLFALFSVVMIAQLLYFFIDFSPNLKKPHAEQQWLSVQTKIDSMKLGKEKFTTKIYPFNPNFITDFKGYKLGMSVSEIDRLLEFRKTNRYVNSAEEFQQVTEISDSLLRKMSPHFKFPDWVKNRRQRFAKSSFKKFEKKSEKIIVKDINLATAEDLKKIYGIGDGLSARILKEKEKFGAFASMDQMKEIWGLSPEVVDKLTISFAIIAPPEIRKLRINDASIKELMQFPYFRYSLAKSIVTYRSMNGKISSSEDLAKITDFPVDKIKIIALYLEF